MIDTKLLDILACPACKGDIEYDAKNEKILCTECARKYPVKDGIPVMLVDEAELDQQITSIAFLIRLFAHFAIKNILIDKINLCCTLYA